MEYLDSAATYCGVPLALSLDLASTIRDDGIQYRAGIHQVRAATPLPSLLLSFDPRRSMVIPAREALCISGSCSMLLLRHGYP